MVFKFGIIGCGSVARDHATIIKKLGHKIVLGITKSNKSKNWKLFKKIFPETKFANKISEILDNNEIQYIVSCLPVEEQKKYCKKKELNKNNQQSGVTLNTAIDEYKNQLYVKDKQMFASQYLKMIPTNL